MYKVKKELFFLQDPNSLLSVSLLLVPNINTYDAEKGSCTAGRHMCCSTKPDPGTQTERLLAPPIKRLDVPLLAFCLLACKCSEGDSLGWHIKWISMRAIWW